MKYPVGSNFDYFCDNQMTAFLFPLLLLNFYEAQGGHSPDHMEFPDFSLTFPVQASKNYRHTVLTL